MAASEGPRRPQTADRVLWDRDLLRCPARGLLEARALRVERGDEVVWES